MMGLFFFGVINEKDGEDKRWRDRDGRMGGRASVTNCSGGSSKQHVR